jgi:hypothetical protein
MNASHFQPWFLRRVTAIADKHFRAESYDETKAPNRPHPICHGREGFTPFGLAR